MEPKERPTKLRKLEHTIEHETIHVPKKAPLDEADSPTVNVDRSTTATHDDETANCHEPSDIEAEAGPRISKNQLKKRRRLEHWEAGREDRKLKRKAKIKEKRERKRVAFEESRATGEPQPQTTGHVPRQSAGSGVQVPITIIFDCDFEELMFDNELKSLGLQITRCYSDNRKAPYRFQLAVSSFGGKMKERFDGILAKQYQSWKGVKFCEEDFVQVSEMAKEWMGGEKGGQVAGALERASSTNGASIGDEKEHGGEVVYLSSESDVTLERLRPNSVYIIGGLVDKNRHKGICYKRALDRGIKTAKLPIGQYLQMRSRQVLVTNHVQEIMLRWLEYNDWGKALIEVLPKRKGGVLKSEAQEADDEEQDPLDVGEGGKPEVESSNEAD